MNLPGVSDKFFTERAGVNAVAAIVNDLRCIWRETPNADVGIDGQIEFVDERGATGQLVAVQVKSGPSYLVTSEGQFVYYPGEKHLNYWEAFPIPVVLIIYDPDRKIGYWADARRQLRAHTGLKSITVPRDQTLSKSARLHMFESCGALGLPVLEPDAVLDSMVKQQTGSPSFPLSFFQLFANGMTDIGRKLFFSMDLVINVVEINLAVEQKTQFYHLGFHEYEFLHQYVVFLVSQDLVVFDYSDYLIELRERELVASWLVPFTRRGREVFKLAREKSQPAGHRGLTELLVSLQIYPGFDERVQENILIEQKLGGASFVPPVVLYPHGGAGVSASENQQI